MAYKSTNAIQNFGTQTKLPARLVSYLSGKSSVYLGDSEFGTYISFADLSEVALYGMLLRPRFLGRFSHCLNWCALLSHMLGHVDGLGALQRHASKHPIFTVLLTLEIAEKDHGPVFTHIPGELERRPRRRRTAPNKEEGYVRMAFVSGSKHTNLTDKSEDSLGPLGDLVIPIQVHPTLSGLRRHNSFFGLWEIQLITAANRAWNLSACPPQVSHEQDAVFPSSLALHEAQAR
ncbi:hypothetical protein B0H66DRAFT_527692 [Apodospora peruviana]|uniref:Uncharacterized protein n=1 Tax=Apodospora peruviana TaxID=516989 RepID=A0AAE0ISG4_9PEZI|nr:hypothetical protein B0H66DRAFT_527692 [Apodospora peruviana]